MKKRVILVGQAGSGKDFFRDHCSLLMELDVSFTTRPQRDGEQPGYTYHYVTTHQFENMVDGGNMHEAVAFNGWNYGTSRDSWEHADLFIMTPSGVSQIPESDRGSCTIIYFDIAEAVRRKRLELRSDFDSVERRIAADAKDFDGFNDFDIRITNPTYDCMGIYDLINFYEKCDTQ